MKRREFIALVGGASLAWPLVVHAQQPHRVRRVGVLVSGSPPDSIADALRSNLRDLGYSEGQNIAFEVRFAMDRSGRTAELAAELVRLDVEIIVAHFTPAAIAAKEATRTIPILMSSVGAPVENGLVESLARPGGNVTGQSNLGGELGSKRLELLRQVIPRLSRVAVLVSATATNPYTRLFVHEIEAAAANAGIRVDPILVDGPSDFDNAFATMAKSQAQAAVVQPLLDPHRMIIIELAAKHRLATMFGFRESTVAGGLISYSADQAELSKRLAVFVDKILKGAKPADLPVEQPTKFVLTINLKTAKALGLTVPPALLAQADEMIE